ncbi:MAG: peptidase Ste24p [Frankiales bacterium]|nr:peptidase Ste24p [Frankiales bacterium]
MILFAIVPFVFALALHFTSAFISRALPPAWASWLLTVLSLTVSVTCGLILSAAAVISLARLPEAAQLGHWSAPIIEHGGAPPVWLGVLATLVVSLLLSMALIRSLRSISAIAAARYALRGLEVPQSNLVVIENASPTAYSVGGLHGRIVVSTSMLRALSAGERRVLLAHEAAHVRHHHYLFVQLCEVAAAANPLVRASVSAVRVSVERWADEVAARDVGDRALAARGLARAALACSTGQPMTRAALGISDGDVVLRVRALLSAPPTQRRQLAALLALVVPLCWLAAAVVAIRTHGLIELAEHAYFS